MKALLSRLIGPSLILLIALTSIQLGAARGQARIAGQMVLCTGQGIVTVSVDANGTPVTTTHACPDCALTLLTGLVAAFEPFRPKFSARSLHIRSGPTPTLASVAHAFLARGPPSLTS